MTERKEHTVAVLIFILDNSELFFITLKYQATKKKRATTMTCFLNARRKHYDARFKLMVITTLRK